MPHNSTIAKRYWLSAWLLPLFGVGALGLDSPIPAPLPKDRYAAMRATSPFALATAAAPTVAPQASFAANWFVSGIGRLNDEDYVTIKARDFSAQFSLFGREPNPQNGVSLASVNWSDTVGQSTVILQKGTETAKLEFNEAEMRGPVPATQGNGTAPAPKPPGTAQGWLPSLTPPPKPPATMSSQQSHSPIVGPGVVRPNTPSSGRPPEIRHRPGPIQPPR